MERIEFTPVETCVEKVDGHIHGSDTMLDMSNKIGPASILLAFVLALVAYPQPLLLAKTLNKEELAKRLGLERRRGQWCRAWHF
jgi:hypothetical protein